MFWINRHNFSLPFSLAFFITISPADTSVSLFAKATFFSFLSLLRSHQCQPNSPLNLSKYHILLIWQSECYFPPRKKPNGNFFFQNFRFFYISHANIKWLIFFYLLFKSSTLPLVLSAMILNLSGYLSTTSKTCVPTLVLPKWLVFSYILT